MEKKKLIGIKKRIADSTGNYGYSTMSFAFVSSPIHGRTQCTGLATCRETVNSTILCAKTGHSLALHNPDQDAPVDFEKLRLLIVIDVNKDLNDFKTRLFSGKALLNRYEEKAGWIPSKITTVKHPNCKNAWLLTGPKEWMSHPQLLSIATFIMRLASVHGPFDTDSFKQAENSLRTLYSVYKKKEKSAKNFTHFPDINYLKYIDDIKLLITNIEKVFDGITLDKAWLDIDGSNSNFGVYSGMLTFFEEKGPTYNKEITIAKTNFINLKKNQLSHI